MSRMALSTLFRVVDTTINLFSVLGICLRRCPKNHISTLLREYLRGESEEAIDEFVKACEKASGLKDNDNKSQVMDVGCKKIQILADLLDQSGQREENPPQIFRETSSKIWTGNYVGIFACSLDGQMEQMISVSSFDPENGNRFFAWALLDACWDMPLLF